MKRLCSFSSRIHGVCILPEDRAAMKRQRRVFLLTLAILAVLLMFFMPWYVPLIAAVCAIVLYNFISHRLYIRKQYQPVTIDVFSDENDSFVLSIPQYDIAGYARRRLSAAQIDAVSAFEYSPSLHCVRIEANFLTVLYSYPESQKLSTEQACSSWYLYMPEEEEKALLAILETLLRRKAFNMDAPSSSQPLR